MPTLSFRRRPKVTRKPHSGDVSDCKIKGLLGQGGFAKVYAVHRDEDPRDLDVALKILPLERFLTSSGMTVNETLSHVRDIQRLCDGDHPNLIRMLDYRLDVDNIFLFLELCEGQDLFDRVLKSPAGHLSELETRDVAKSLCSAVDFIHSRGVLHRDIKPENCFFRRKDSPMSDVILADFDCSLITSTPTAWYRGSAGSPGYVSPEMCAGRPWNYLTDEWSLGTTLYECLTGRSPCVEAADDGARYQLFYEQGVPFPPRYWKEHSNAAKCFVRALLEVDVSLRMTCGEALSHAWLEETPALSPTWPQYLRRGITSDSALSWDTALSDSSVDTICVTPPELDPKDFPQKPALFLDGDIENALNAKPKSPHYADIFPMSPFSDDFAVSTLCPQTPLRVVNL